MSANYFHCHSLCRHLFKKISYLGTCFSLTAGRLDIGSYEAVEPWLARSPLSLCYIMQMHIATLQPGKWLIIHLWVIGHASFRLPGWPRLRAFRPRTRSIDSGFLRERKSPAMPLPSLPTFDYGSWLKSESILRLQIYKCTPDNLDNEAQVELELILVGIFSKLLSSLFSYEVWLGIIQFYLKKEKREKKIGNKKRIKSAETSKVFTILKRVYCSKILWENLYLKFNAPH